MTYIGLSDIERSSQISESALQRRSFGWVKYYRVRKSWDDAKSQLVAYTMLANAKAMADKNLGEGI